MRASSPSAAVTWRSRSSAARGAMPAKASSPPPVSLGLAAPGGDLAREDQRLVPTLALARFVVQAELGQQGAHLGGAPRVAGRVEREDALDARARRAGADELGAGALAEDRAERVDDDRLARDGLRGRRGEAL